MKKALFIKTINNNLSKQVISFVYMHIKEKTYSENIGLVFIRKIIYACLIILFKAFAHIL